MYYRNKFEKTNEALAIMYLQPCIDRNLMKFPDIKIPDEKRTFVVFNKDNYRDNIWEEWNPMTDRYQAQLILNDSELSMAEMRIRLLEKLEHGKDYEHYG